MHLAIGLAGPPGSELGLPGKEPFPRSHSDLIWGTPGDRSWARPSTNEPPARVLRVGGPGRPCGRRSSAHALPHDVCTGARSEQLKKHLRTKPMLSDFKGLGFTVVSTGSVMQVAFVTF